MKKQIPESVDLKLVDAVALIDSYSRLIFALGCLIDDDEPMPHGHPEIEKCIEWTKWYEEFTGRHWGHLGKD